MIVGLTGGIGSGKSTVAEMFKDLGIPVFIADEEAKALLAADPEVVSEVTALLGPEAYKDGHPDRAWIAGRVFAEKELLNKLNAIIHPAVAARFAAWYKAQEAPYVIYEAAILFEHGGHKKCDRVILVTAPEDIRLKRVVKRDRTASETVKARMAHQWPDEQKIPMADIVIENINLTETLKIVKKIHKLFVKI